MNFESLVAEKSAGAPLNQAEISFLVERICASTTSDAAVTDFVRAVFSQGMNINETAFLTDAMRNSGMNLSWKVNGPVVDKHSTGGVGDLVSLILAPVLAACGCYVPMISGRCLGHTGGTVDKLESIPGYHVQPDHRKFVACVEQVGCAIVAQSHSLVPADRRIYAIRDKTNTVNSVPLIVSSILSKKLAEGLDALVLDIKIGNGAWFSTESDAKPIADSMQNVSEQLGLKTYCCFSQMNSPSSYAVGNALEVREAIDFLSNTKQHPELKALVETLACKALMLAKLHDTEDSAILAVRRAISSGNAAECFAKMVAFLGGPKDLLSSPDTYLKPAAVIKPVLSTKTGIVDSFNMKRLGQLSHSLSHVNRSATGQFDHSTGITDLSPKGKRVETGETIAFVHAVSESEWALANTTILNDCISISETRDSSSNENSAQQGSFA